ncbi:MAG TPA: PfkB family carbohydrate kinase [Actinomycetota bacterium]|nr:PfkB family carbohydrate kinase [Actinomycetota bacterium]
MSTFDIAVVGAPFLDLTFAGLPRVPGPGEEIIARELHIAPGGTGMQAIGAARLGLSAALVSPIGDDPAGEVLRTMLSAEGVEWIGRRTGSTATTTILSTPDGSAMATAFDKTEPTAGDVVAVGASAFVLSLGRLPLRPPNGAVYATTGGIELEAGLSVDARSLDGVRALILNEREANRLTGATDSAAAATTLARDVECVVVTLGPRGALAVENGREVRVEAPGVVAVDTTGAGDLFVPAYIWADLNGLDVEGRVAWAALYAGLSVRAPTAFDGAARLDELLTEGARRGLRRERSAARPD